MQKPERLIGFVEVEDINYPFEFNEETFTLNLYPPSVEVQDKKRFAFWDVINGTAKDVHEWTPHKRISGVSFGGKATATVNGSVFSGIGHHILFDVQNFEANYNGFISYQVNWYFLHKEGIRQFGISGFRLSGSTINYFYNPEVVLQRKVEFAEDGTGLTGFSVSSVAMQCNVDCGEYLLTDDVTAKITVTAYPTMHYQTASNPIDAMSVFTTMFSRPLRDGEIDVLIKAYEHSRLFFHYVSYRRNIGLYNVDVCYLNENNKLDYSGLLVFKEREQEEIHKEANQRMIDYSVIGTHTAELFSLVAKHTFDYEHICESIDDTHIYSSSRAFMILAEFERESSDIYGRDSDRSQAYQNVKQNILNMIDEIIASSSKKEREYAKKFRRHVEKHSNGFQSNIIKALNDCRLIMEPFVRKKYQSEFNEAVEGIGKRMGDMRNGLAHSDLFLRLEPIHLIDLKIVEELIYAMRLKTILQDPAIVQKGISNLFGESLDI